ncbi:NINE protein [Brachybacterium sp. AOP43-C2-M15]|uniref:NINE protein n=1 Tax=Brachybacterium sp. AOP43-C2-M15 TaxID=3457661 RepID=UPI00403470F5
MSNPGDNASWDPQGNQDDAQQPPQDPWAQPPAPQDPYGQPPAEAGQYGHQDPYGQQSADAGQYGQQDPYGQQSADAGQYGQQDPYGQQPGAGQEQFGQQDPYGQGQHWSPAPSSGASASDPYAQGGAAHGRSSAGQPPAGGGQGPVPPGEPQSRLVVGLLGIFLGGVGVHRFLLGYTTIGIIQIVVTFVTCGIGAWWGIIEGIMVLARAQAFEYDAHGRPLKD